MITAHDFVQDFLFKDKPNRAYCNKFDAKDLENLLILYAKYVAEQNKHATNNDI